MNIERTMHFILQSQARAEVRAEKGEVRMDRRDARTSAVEKRLDRRMDAITKLVHQGMRVLVRIEGRVEDLAKAQKELATSQKELADAQKKTERSLKTLLDSLIQSRNGH